MIGLCECGCGLSTKIAKETCRARGLIKGQPMRFIRGHNPTLARRPEIRISNFYRHVEMIPECGCWIWMGATYSRGYGQIRFNGKPRKAHRVSYEIHKGPIPEGMEVMHSCDTPLCVNPYHLFPGTHIENMKDMVRKSRQAFGSRVGASKLNDDAVRAIKKSTLSCGKLSMIYSVRPQTIQGIKSNKRWKHVKEASCLT